MFRSKSIIIIIIIIMETILAIRVHISLSVLYTTHVLSEDTLKSHFVKGTFQAAVVKLFIFTYAFCLKELSSAKQLLKYTKNLRQIVGATFM
jgi:hypothetical protein